MSFASIRNTTKSRLLPNVREAASLRNSNILREQLSPVAISDSTPMSQSDAEAVFADLHTESESYYKGNGGWETLAEMGHIQYTEDDTPAPRSTARRVISYIYAYRVTSNDIYRSRALSGLSWLLDNQCSDGRFDEAGTYGEVKRDRSDRGDAYSTAMCGKALVEGYIEFGDTNYLTASENAGTWEISGAIYQDDSNPLESLASFKNANHVGFIIWHLASHHKVSSNTTFLERAIWGAQQLIDWQIKDGTNSDGTWYYYEGNTEKRMVYHCITLRGLLEVYSALEANSTNADFKVILESAIYRALDYMIRWQITSGEGAGFLPWQESEPDKLWAAGPEPLCIAYSYLDTVIKNQITPLLYKLVKLHKERYDTYGTSLLYWSIVVSGDTRQHLILNFGQYLRAFFS